MFLFGAEARRVIVFFSSIFFHNGAHDVTNHTSFCFSPPKQIKKNHSTASLCGVLVHASNVFFKLYSQLQFISMLCLQRVFLVYLVHACCKFLYRRGYNQSALIQSFVVASVHIYILMNFYIVSYFFCWYVHLLFEYLSAILLWWCYFLIPFFLNFLLSNTWTSFCLKHNCLPKFLCIICVRLLVNNQQTSRLC